MLECHGVGVTLVRFRLLGDVYAEISGRPIALGHARQRCVLVALLVEANRSVSMDELISRVWGERAPRRARDAAYAYVSRLRRALAASNEVSIVRRTSGYLLTADPLTVDLHQFRSLIHRARGADTSAAALALHERALQLWRGVAFADLDTPWLATVREDLHRQRRAAELDRNDLALDVGRHTELLAELSTAAMLAPLDERLAGQLMLALYRSGRQADALAHFHQVRRRLSDELGTDPTRSLRELYQQVLAANPVLSGPTGPTSPTRTTGPRTTSRTDRPVPRQLPARPGRFAGRVDELAQLDALLATNANGAQPAAVVISAICGTAGVGKTALAVYWAHRVSDRFPDGQLYVNLRGFDPAGPVVDAVAAVRGFLDALGVPPWRIPADPQAQAALYRSELAARRMLVVLDNARDTAQVRPLLPGGPGCVVLVTSRNQLTGLIATDGAQPLVLDLLSPSEAQELLMHRLGTARVTAEQAAVTELISRCARLPLALAIVAARAATYPHLPLQAVADRLQDAGTRLDSLTTDDSQADVCAAFSLSYRALSIGAARLFRLLGLHPGTDITAQAIASLTALPHPQVQHLLTELVDANLLTERVSGRYTLHDLLRVYAAQLTRTTETDEQRHAARRRLLDHYLHTGYAADRLLNGTRDPITIDPPAPGVSPEQFTDHQRAMDWFATEHHVLLAALHHAPTAGFDTHTWQLAWTLRTVLHRREHWQDQLAAARAAVAAAHRTADQQAQALVHRDLAHAYTRLGRFDEAETELEHALALYCRIGDQVGRAHTHNRLAHLWGRRGSPVPALDHARQSLDLFRACEHRNGQALALNAVGWYHALLDDHRRAIAYCQQALTLFQQLGNREGQAATWDSLGYAHHHLGHHDRAVTCYQHALELARKLGDRYDEADTLTHLGDTHHAAGDLPAARRSWQQALAILDGLHHPDADRLCSRLAALRTGPIQDSHKTCTSPTPHRIGRSRPDGLGQPG